jgi:hypothetical protein
MRIPGSQKVRVYRMLLGLLLAPGMFGIGFSPES